MVDRPARDELARLIRALVAGWVTTDEFQSAADDVVTDGEDPVVRVLASRVGAKVFSQARRCPRYLAGAGCAAP